MWRHVYRDFSDLSKSEQLALFQAMKQDLFPEEREDIAKMLKDIRETRFSGGLACLHCGSISVKKNGKYRARQRYLCKDCGKTFNDMTNTPLSGSRYPHKWLKYFEMMVDGYTLPKISKALEIHISTAFYWRHKILNAVRSLGNQTLKGIVESDETFFLESDKGKKSITHREPRKRGGVATKRGISKEQICVLVAQDRNGQVISQTAGKGRIKSTDIDKVLGSFIDTSALLCSDTATNYKKFAKDKGLQHEMVNMRKGIYVKKSIFHIQHVNAYHKRLKQFMERFQGVATKYLDNYLYWFRYLEQSKEVAQKERVKKLLFNAVHKSNYSTVEMLRSA
ncbi:MAG: IS1595 family transposase [Bacillus paranthracis]|nr:IS1595 family transposase [Bacillus paranthracis]